MKVRPSTAATALGSLRIIFGIAPLVAPQASQRMMRFPEAHDNPSARLITGLFAVRELALGAQLIAARNDREKLPRLARFNAVIDAGDAVSNATFLVRRQGIPVPAAMSFVAACGGCAAWSWLAKAAAEQ